MRRLTKPKEIDNCTDRLSSVRLVKTVGDLLEVLRELPDDMRISDGVAPYVDIAIHNNVLEPLLPEYLNVEGSAGPPPENPDIYMNGPYWKEEFAPYENAPNRGCSS